MNRRLFIVLGSVLAGGLLAGGPCRGQVLPGIDGNPRFVGVVLPWHRPGELTAGYKLIDGDIQVPMDFNPAADASFTVTLWPGGIVPYEFDANVPAAYRGYTQEDMALWEAVAGVHFVPRNGEADYVHLQDSNGNNSPVGWRAGQTTINITSWTFIYIVDHELGHCLGYFHEHQRPDRDTYVQINSANVQPDFLNANFPIVASATTWGPYDFDSVMHYSGCSFSVCCDYGAGCDCAPGCRTIQVRPPWDAQWQGLIGQRNHFSVLDGAVMRGLYPLPGDRWLDQSYSGAIDGSFRFPFHSTFLDAFTHTPGGGTLFIAPGTYASTTALYNSPRSIKAPIGDVVLH